MKHSVEAADELIFCLYAAMRETSLLPPLVARISRQFRAHIAGIRINDAGYASYRYASSIGLSPNKWETFDTSCVKCNVRRPRSFDDMMRDGVGHSETILPRRELVKTTFYDEFTKRIGIDHGMGLCLWAQPPGQMVAISLNRSHRVGAYDASDLAYAKTLLPHFRSAYVIMRRMSWMNSERASYESAIDRLAVGLLACDASGACRYRNENADRALGGNIGLTLTAGNILRCTDPDAQFRLRDALTLAAQDRLDVPARIYVRDRFGALRFTQVVTKLHGDIRVRTTRGEACAAEERLRDAFRLTGAEARLAAQLVGGDEVAACAQTLGVSLATVRTQLRSLFAKTGTNRQTALLSALNFVLRATWSIAVAKNLIVSKSQASWKFQRFVAP